MISIHSAEENKFALDLAKREKTKPFGVWIGAKRNNSVDYFEWTNGQKLNYSNWHSGEPKSSTDPESHVFIYINGIVYITKTDQKCHYLCRIVFRIFDGVYAQFVQTFFKALVFAHF